MPDWLSIVSKTESSFKGKIFVSIGAIQTWRTFPKGNYKMKNCTISCLWNKNIALPNVSFKWNNLPLDMSHFGMRVTKTVILLIVTQLMREWYQAKLKDNSQWKSVCPLLIIDLWSLKVNENWNCLTGFLIIIFEETKP